MIQLDSPCHVARLAQRLVPIAVFCLLSLAASAAKAQAPTVDRPAPFPSYRVGDTAVTLLSTQPAQAFQPVYRFRRLNGTPEGGEEGVYLGDTGADGRFEVELVLEAVAVGHYTEERFAVGSPDNPKSAAKSYHVHANAAPTAFRDSPFPAYNDRDVARVEIATDPPQPYQPVYRERYKNGQIDEGAAVYIGDTDGHGVLLRELDLSVFQIGHYTGERFAVGTSGGPQSAPLSYDVHATEPPSASRTAPFPTYTEGDQATLEISTQPAQPFQKVYRYRLLDGMLDGPQPTTIGTTDEHGRLTNTYTLTGADVGSYSDESFAVGTESGPTSDPRSYTVAAAQSPVHAERPLPAPDYTVGDTGTLTVTTDPVQAAAPVYRFRQRDGAADGAQPTLVGTTDTAGVFTGSAVFDAADVGSYSDERYAVGDPAGPTSPALAFTVSLPPAPEIHSMIPNVLATGEVTDVTIWGEHLSDLELSVTGHREAVPGLAVLAASDAGDRVDLRIDATDSAVEGLYTLGVDNPAGGSSTALRVLPPGPVVDAFTPEEPARGRIFSLMILGSGLMNAKVRSNGTGIGLMAIASSENQITGLMQVGAEVPLGGADLIIEGANGGQTVITLDIHEAGTAPRSGRRQTLVTAEAAAKAAKVGQAVPEIYLQDLSFADAGDPGGPGASEKSFSIQCRISLFAQYSIQRTIALPFDPLTGRIDRDLLQQLQFGVPVPVGVRLLSYFVDLFALLDWQCWPPTPPSVCIWGRVGFEIAGLGGQILEAGGCLDRGHFSPWLTTSGIFGDFSWGTPPNSHDCLDVTSLDSPPGHQLAEVELRDCCHDQFRISGEGIAFPDSVYSWNYEAQNLPLLAASPAAASCPANRFNVVVRSFIPWNYTDTEGGEVCFSGDPAPKTILFEGDDRDFMARPVPRAPQLGFRMEQKVSLYPDEYADCPDCDANGVVQGSRKNTSGLSSNYEKSSSLSNLPPNRITSADRDGVVDDCYLLDAECQHQPWELDWRIDAERTDDQTVRLTFAAGANHCATFIPAPDINWGYQLLLHKSGAYAISGLHDCFPAHEVYINDHLVWGYWPRVNGGLYGGTCLALPPSITAWCSGTVGVDPGCINQPGQRSASVNATVAAGALPELSRSVSWSVGAEGLGTMPLKSASTGTRRSRPEIGAAARAALRALREGEPAERIAAAKQLMERPLELWSGEIDSTLATLLAALGDPEAWVRRSAAFAFQQATQWLWNPQEAGSAPEPTRRRNAALLSAAGPALSLHLDDQDSTVRRYLLMALTSWGPQPPLEAQSALLRRLDDEDPVARDWALLALGRLRPVSPEVLSAIAGRLKQGENKGAAARGLALLYGREWRTGKKADLRGRKDLVAAHEDAVSALIQGLGSKDVEVRKYAARALGEAGPAARGALDRLREMQKDLGEVPEIRREAARAAERIEAAVESR